MRPRLHLVDRLTLLLGATIGPGIFPGCIGMAIKNSCSSEVRTQAIEITGT